MQERVEGRIEVRKVWLELVDEKRYDFSISKRWRALI